MEIPPSVLNYLEGTLEEDSGDGNFEVSILQNDSGYSSVANSPNFGDGSPVADSEIVDVIPEHLQTDKVSPAMKQISNCIRSHLRRRSGRIRSTYLFKPYKVTFDVECDIPGFIQEQEYNGAAAEVLPKVITLTGSIHDVQATTCEQYLIQTWPTVGCNLLQTIQGALREGNASESQFSCNCKFEDRTEIRVFIGRSMKVEAIGKVDFITEIGEQIGWLATAFRPSFQDSEISFCHPEIINFRAEDVTGSLLSLKTKFGQAFTCRVKVVADHVEVNLPLFNGQCWYRIFNNPVIVTGYPIKSREFLRSGVGLELPFDMMTTLADARYLTTFDNRTLVKGFSTTLIPTEIHDSTILWHLLINETGARISYRDPQIQQGILIEPDRLNGARHILGWCTNALNNIGSPNASYDIEYSGLSQGRGRLSCERIELSVGAGSYFRVGTTFARGKKDRSSCNFVANGYVSLVEHIGKHHIVLYDVKEKRAWLSDGIPVLLHLVRTSLRREEKEDPNRLFTEHIKKLNEAPPSAQGVIAAKAVLFDDENRLSSLRLIDTKVTEQIIERTVNGKTIKENVRITEPTYYRFENRVEEICLLLEKAIDQTAKAINKSLLRDTPKNLLSGFDFVSVATRSKLRHIETEISIPSSAYGWTDLLGPLEAITLFGCDFGELIKPGGGNPSKSCDRCGYEASLPSGENHLAVCVDVLQKITEMNGNKYTTGWRLTDDIYWHFNKFAFGCCCSSFNARRVNAKTSNWVQTLSRKSIDHNPESPVSTNAMGNGAVIFGHNWPRLFPVNRNTGADKRHLPPDEITLPQTALEVSVSSGGQNDSCGTNGNQLLNTMSVTTPSPFDLSRSDESDSNTTTFDQQLSTEVSSTTPSTATPTTYRSGSESNHNMSDTMVTNSPNTPNSPEDVELGFSSAAVDQQCPDSDDASEKPVTIDTSPQNIQVSNTLPKPFPKNSFGKIKDTCVKAWKKLKYRGKNQIRS